MIRTPSLFAAALFAVLVAFAAPALAGSGHALVRVEGMDCAGCNKKLSDALTALPSLGDPVAAFAQQAACAPLTGELDEAAIRGAVTAIGYTVVSVESVETCPEGLRESLGAPWEGKTDGLDVVRVSDGEEVDLKAKLAPGKYTIVDFGASWCAPCHDAADSLAAYLPDHDDVAVRVVHLEGETPAASYEAAVVAQHLKYAKGIPWLLAYSPDGKLLLQSESVDKVVAAINKHRTKNAGKAGKGAATR